MRVAAVLAAAFAALAAPALAQPVAPQAAAEAIAAARAELEAARGAEDRAAALTGAVRAYEEALVALRDAVAEAGGEAEARAVALAVRRTEVQRLLAALVRIGRTPPPAQGLHPQGPIGAARAGAMLAHLTSGLAAEADRLAAELAGIEAARTAAREGRTALEDGLAALAAARDELRAALPDQPPAAEGEEAALLAAMTRDSDTLSGLAAAIDGLPGSGDPVGAEEPEAMEWPVAGRVLSEFNAPDAAGVRRPGLMLAAQPLAVVVAPAAARVRYAGPFLDYGYVAVLETGSGTLIVLAGMQVLHVATGAVLERGELIGQLGGRDPDVEDLLMPAVAEIRAPSEETLYIELRHDGEPVDPRPWFAGDNG